MNTVLAVKLIDVAVAAVLATASFLHTGTAHAAGDKLVAEISISRQTMQVSVDGHPAYIWRVSTAGRGYVTPTGSFKPYRMHRMWYSRKYDNAPMPHSVFFHGGYAVHATYAIKRLGRPASHGCVRLHPRNAEDFYELVETFGPDNTSIVISR